MDKKNRDKALEAPERNEEDIVIEVMRGDSDRTEDDSVDGEEHKDKATEVLDSINKESIPSRILKYYRKHFKGRLLRMLTVVVVLALIAGFVYNLILNRSFTVTFYQIRSEKVSDNIRIVELADLHNNKFGKNNSKLVAKIKALHPDLIFYAGDMMNYKNSDYSVLFDLSDKLSEIAPIYACYGNNEYDQYLFIDRDFRKKLEEHKVKVLSNEAMDVTVGKTTFQLIAVSEGVDQYDAYNAKKFIDKLEPTDKCRICLTHYPELFFEKLKDKDIDIAFTGHAHGGLVRLPKIGGIYANGQGFMPKLTSGVNTMGDGTRVVVSRGLGQSSIWPRINNQPELVVADICWY